MKVSSLLVAALLSILTLYPHYGKGQDVRSTSKTAEVWISILTIQEHFQGIPKVVSFRDTSNGTDFVSSFHSDYGGPDQTHIAYVAKHIPYGVYIVRLTGTPKGPDIVRTITISSFYEHKYFTADIIRAHIMFVDPRGSLINNAIIDKVVDHFGTDYTNDFVKTSNAVIPYGTYTIQAHAEGYDSANAEVCFCQAVAWSVIGMNFSIGDAIYPGSNVRVKGSISIGGPIMDPIIVRFSLAYMDGSMSTVILPGEDGRFEMHGSLYMFGDYVLVVSQSGRVLGSSVVNLPIRKAQTITLSSGTVITLEPF
jgi:hypothetical protein